MSEEKAKKCLRNFAKFFAQIKCNFIENIVKTVRKFCNEFGETYKKNIKEWSRNFKKMLWKFTEMSANFAKIQGNFKEVLEKYLQNFRKNFVEMIGI